MRTTWKPLTFLLSFTFLFLFSGSVYGDDFQDSVDAYVRKDYKEAFRLYRLSCVKEPDINVPNLNKI